MEENTSKAYVATAGLMSPMAPTSGAGSALFVINLCASIAPVQTDGKNLPGLDNYRLYQVARVEDGRTRHRLRLGFFTSEAHAESVLTVVRQQYPTAFTTCLCDEDRKFARGYLPEAAPPPARPVAVVVNKPAVAQPKPVAQPKQAAPAPAAQKKTAPAAASAAPAAAKTPPAPSTATSAAAKPAAAKTLSRAEPEVIELTWEPEPTAKAQPAAANAAPTPKQPALPPEAAIDELTWEPPALTPAKANAGKSTSDTAKHPVLKPGFKTQPVVKAQPAATAAPAAAKPAPKADPAPKVDSAASMRVPALQLTLSDPPPPPRPQTKVAPTEPFRVSKGVEIADVGISLQAEPPPRAVKANPPPAAKQPAPTLKATKPTATKPAVPAPKPAATPTQAKPAPVKPTPPARPSLANLPELDSTQTIRALTSAELNDDVQEKWFAIQLAVSDQPVNLDAMPHLDIFEAYRLYSVATAGSGKIVHSLRLGFFKEAVSAEAVSGYLKTFFGSPTVLRISVAEQARFKDPPTRKAEPPESKQAKVFELNNARAARPVIPTVTMEVAPPPAVDPSATGSFKPNATGSFQTSASGTHKTLKPAAKSAGPATKRGSALKTGASGKYKMPLQKKSLSQQLMEEAREVELAESGIRKLPKNDSLLSRLVGKLTK